MANRYSRHAANIEVLHFENVLFATLKGNAICLGLCELDDTGFAILAEKLYFDSGIGAGPLSMTGLDAYDISVLRAGFNFTYSLELKFKNDVKWT